MEGKRAQGNCCPEPQDRSHHFCVCLRILTLLLDPFFCFLEHPPRSAWKATQTESRGMVWRALLEACSGHIRW